MRLVEFLRKLFRWLKNDCMHLMIVNFFFFFWTYNSHQEYLSFSWFLVLFFNKLGRHLRVSKSKNNHSWLLELETVKDILNFYCIACKLTSKLWKGLKSTRVLVKSIWPPIKSIRTVFWKASCILPRHWFEYFKSIQFLFELLSSLRARWLNLFQFILFRTVNGF